MKLENLETLKIGDIIYSFVNNNFYIYKVTNISLFTREITVCIESINNVKNGEDYSIIHIPFEDRYNDIKNDFEDWLESKCNKAGNFRNNLDFLIYTYNDENNEKDSLQNYIKNHGKTILPKYLKYFEDKW